MHKDTVKAITLALTQKSREDLVKIVVEDKPISGFWKMTVIIKPGYEQLIPHIKGIGLRIGRFYGEGLAINDWYNTVEFS